MKIEEVLEKYKNSEIDANEAKRLLASSEYEEMGFAKLDLAREKRTGFPEVIFCSGKDNEFLLSIYKKLYDKNGCAFGTRASLEQAEYVINAIPDAIYDPVSRILKVGKLSRKDSIGGSIAVCTGGTSDIPVAEEAAQVAEYFGAKVVRVYDVGISGLNRLLTKIDVIRSSECVIAVAGMEGALPTVISGLVKNPVIAVPTSVGYGANFEGLSALLTMMNSCANGVSVVNIDNGYGAGYIATQIARLASNRML